MRSVTLSQPTPRTVAEYEAAFDLLLAEMQRIHENMDSNRGEIDRLKVEANILQSETRAILASIGAPI